MDHSNSGNQKSEERFICKTLTGTCPLSNRAILVRLVREVLLVLLALL